jgi:hypothetical protein
LKSVEKKAKVDKMSEEEEYVPIETVEVEIKDYMDSVELIVSSPESYTPIEGPASSNVTYQHIYVSVVP